MIKYIITLTLTRFWYYIIRNNTYGGLTAQVVGLEILLLLVGLGFKGLKCKNHLNMRLIFFYFLENS